MLQKWGRHKGHHLKGSFTQAVQRVGLAEQVHVQPDTPSAASAQWLVDCQPHLASCPQVVLGLFTNDRQSSLCSWMLWSWTETQRQSISLLMLKLQPSPTQGNNFNMTSSFNVKTVLYDDLHGFPSTISLSSDVLPH